MSIGHIILDLAGLELTREDQEVLHHPQVAGVILFKRNYESKQQLQYLTRDILKCNENLIIAVDQEGGRVQRFLEGFTHLPAFSEYGKEYEKDVQAALTTAETLAYTMAKELLDCHVSLSFTPVLDVDVGLSTVIGDRSFHKDVNVVIELGRAFISGMHKAGMPATGKHFPGHGAISADSHVTLPVDNRSYDVIAQQDLKPFAVLSTQLDAIMPAHVLYSEVDDKPACFSSFWLQKVLREQLNFKGVIVSDDLTMEGAKIMGDYIERTASALNAGCDLVIICHDRAATIAVLDEFENYYHAESNFRLSQLRKITTTCEV